MDLQLPSSLTRTFRIKRIGNGQDIETGRIVDTVAAEEPLDIRVTYSMKAARISQNVALTMRTPGNDEELAAGFLLSEGIVTRREQILELRSLGIPPSNEIAVELSEDVDFEAWRMSRNTFLSSSCGICGKRSSESLFRSEPAAPSGIFTIMPDLIRRLPDLLRSHQSGFDETGGLHAAALVNSDGQVERVFEDIGRHNALDKLLGFCLLHGKIPLHDRVLFMSSRSSFELVQKAIASGAPILATIGGPSSLAVDTARNHGLTLVGFVRNQRFNIYSGDWRINS